MFLCLFAGILLARPSLADVDQLLELSVGARQNSARQDGQNAAFNTDETR